MLLPQDVKSLEQALIRALGTLDRLDALGAHRVIPLRAPASLGRRLAEPRYDEPFVLEPIERRVERAGRGAPSGPLLNLFANRDAVSVIAEAHDREQNNLLELAEIRVAAHLPYIVGETLLCQQAALLDADAKR